MSGDCVLTDCKSMGPVMSNFNQETVLSVHHWTDNLFSFTTTRDSSFRFRNGEFTMIGLKVGEKPLLRAYSVASANYEENLEFFSIKVPDGPLTSRLQHLKEGDQIIVSRKATGTLVIDNLVKRALVQRDRHPADRRVSLISLTPLGRETIERVFPVHARVITQQFNVLTEEEQITLGRLCRKLGKQEGKIEDGRKNQS